MRLATWSVGPSSRIDARRSACRAANAAVVVLKFEMKPLRSSSLVASAAATRPNAAMSRGRSRGDEPRSAVFTIAEPLNAGLP